MTVSCDSLGARVAASAARYPDRAALYVAGTTYTYRVLHEHAMRLAQLICNVDQGDVPLCAVYAKRSLWTYVGILGTLLAGRGYVPLNPAFPAQRCRTMLELAGVSTLIADRDHSASLGEVVRDIPRRLTILLPDCDRLPAWVADCPQHRILDAGALLNQPASGMPRQVAADDIAYLMFTSGTTGAPKGIGIRQSNVRAYIDAVAERYDIQPADRFSQNFELTFDLSVHDMFVCWSRGACLCVPPERTVMAPARFIREHQLTCWFSTPSTAAIMQQLRMLRCGAFPTLRWSLFCGEPLTAQIADAWQQAASGSTVENLYGPTEATIACTVYTYSAVTSPATCVNGIVPIGRPFGHTRVAVIDEQGKLARQGEVGQLLLGGAQVAPGYWRDPERTAGAFVSLDTLEPVGPWYRTGDLATVNARGDLIYRGRVDDQIKIMGHRVELGEVEAVARDGSDARMVVALGWPRTAAGAQGIILFLTGSRVPDDTILARCKQRLPAYMVPREIHHVDAIPLNANHKVDRQQLLKTRERLA